jgi:hypothetical protein
MSRVITKEESVLLNEASEMFDETGEVDPIRGTTGTGLLVGFSAVPIS